MFEFFTAPADAFALLQILEDLDLRMVRTNLDADGQPVIASRADAMAVLQSPENRLHIAGAFSHDIGPDERGRTIDVFGGPYLAWFKSSTVIDDGTSHGLAAGSPELPTPGATVILCSGAIGIPRRANWPSDESKKALQAFQRRLKKTFTKRGSKWHGPQALEWQATYGATCVSFLKALPAA